MSDIPVYSDFWLEQETYSDYIDPSPENAESAFSIDLIQLASVRRIISNYVDILTDISIPVYFRAMGGSSNVGGKEIYIDTQIKRRKDFDQAVGLALHEAAHTVQSDFDVIKTVPFNAPKFIWDFGKKHNIRKQTLESLLKLIVNIIEDWYIDYWVMDRTPGYIGYYEASYNATCHSPVIDEILISNEFRFPSIASYKFRIINLTNPLTDLNALPGLEQIYKTIDIPNISRLTTTKQRVDVAYAVVEIILKNLKDFHDKYNPLEPSQNREKVRINVDDFFKPKKSDKPGKSETDLTVKDIADTLAQKPKTPDDENKPFSSQSGNPPNKELSKEVKEAVENQQQAINGETKKGELNQLQTNMMGLIEKHGIVLVYVPVVLESSDAVFRVGCIVVKKFTMDLILSGQSVFPMSNFWRDKKGVPQPDAVMAEAVKKGVKLGSKLGKKLLVRREKHIRKNIRKRSGNINRRLLYSAGFDADDIFENIKIIRFSKGSLHITVDASTSMGGKKWEDTITMCVAICKATSMVDNIHVTVSFRSTKSASGVEMPYIVQAYDSKRDKFSKVENLFRFLRPCGFTPEGLAFSAIMDLFTKAAPDEKDKYFLNISDGEPCFRMRSPLTGVAFSYGDGNGVEHTKNQVNKIRHQGIRVLSYYVQDSMQIHDTKKNFRTMYGKGAKFITPDSVIELAETINELFLIPK